MRNPIKPPRHLRFRKPAGAVQLAAPQGAGELHIPRTSGVRVSADQYDQQAALSEQALLAALASQDPQRRQLAAHAFNAFSAQFTDHLIQLSTTGLFPSQQTQGITPAIVLGDLQRQQVDGRWTVLYNLQDRRAQSHPFFKIADTYNAVTFKAYALGERIEIGFVEAAESIYEMEVIAGGLQWNMLWSEWQDLWSTGDGLAAMQVKYANQQAKTAYQVLTASGLSTTSYAAGSTTLESDIGTINNAIVEIKKALYEATAPVGGQQTEEIVGDGAVFYLLYNDHTAGYMERVSKALDARLEVANDNQSVSEVMFPVVPVGTPYVPTGNWYLFLPGRKNIAAVGRDLTIYDFMDPRIAGVADGRVGQGAYKMVRGDANQGRKLALS